jgi:two-component system chemotaxis response regulator CheB
VRVLLADDSDLFADEIRRVLEADRRIHVVGCAKNGAMAVDMTTELRPDLVVMDVQMPVMDGLGAIQQIMAGHPTPILVMTGDPRGLSGELALEATRRGALDLIMKSAACSSGAEEDALRARVRFLARVPVVRHLKARRKPLPSADLAAVPARGGRMIGIVASTGGPAALARLMEDLPPTLDAGIAIVQHLPAGGFAESLASWLGHAGSLSVAVACGGERLTPGRVLIAPDNRHLVIRAGGLVALTDDPPRKGFRPSGDVLLASLARLGRGHVGIVLSGIGADGSEGLRELRHAGGRTLAQDEDSAVIFGMPQAAWKSGAAERMVGIEAMGEVVAGLVGTKDASREVS